MKEFLINSFSHSLPGEEAHFELMPINRPFSSEAIKKAQNYRESAVGIYIFPHQNSFHSVLIQRPSYEGVHSGQVSFPGGKKETGDSSIEFTARRESFEEIGIDLEVGELIGELTQVVIPVSQFIVQPFVYFLEEKPDFILDQREVADVIVFDLEKSLVFSEVQKSSIDLGNGIRRKDVPHFTIENKIVWGATGMILSELRETIRPFFE